MILSAHPQANVKLSCPFSRCATSPNRSPSSCLETFHDTLVECAQLNHGKDSHAYAGLNFIPRYLGTFGRAAGLPRPHIPASRGIATRLILKGCAFIPGLLPTHTVLPTSTTNDTWTVSPSIQHPHIPFSPGAMAASLQSLQVRAEHHPKAGWSTISKRKMTATVANSAAAANNEIDRDRAHHPRPKVP